MLGVRAVYSPNFSDYELLNIGQLLVTRDKELFRRRTQLSLLLITMSRIEWLSILSLVLGFSLSLDMNKSLCPICGSRLTRVSRDAVVNKVPNNVLLRHSDFWLCTGCGRVYWVGSHHVRIRRELETARSILSGLKISCVNNNLLIFHG